MSELIAGDFTSTLLSTFLFDALFLFKIVNFGYHHSKIMLLKYRTGLRVVVITANLTPNCRQGKSQMVWYQDFSRKKPYEDDKREERDKFNGYAETEQEEADAAETAKPIEEAQAAGAAAKELADSAAIAKNKKHKKDSKEVDMAERDDGILLGLQTIPRGSPRRRGG